MNRIWIVGLCLFFLTIIPSSDDFAVALEVSHENVVNAAESRFWGSAEYLYWFREERKLPPLATTSPSGTPRASAGILGEPATQILIGDEDIGENGSHGGRATLGVWFDQDARIGIGGSIFRLEEDEIDFSRRGNASGAPILAVPFFNTQIGQEDALLVSYNGIAGSGAIHVDTKNDIYGGDIYLRWNFSRRENWRWDALIGYSFSRIKDDLSLSTQTTSISSAVPAGTTLTTDDDFDIENNFHCLSLGLAGEYRKNSWGITGLARLRVGNAHQEAKISGKTQTTIPGSGSTRSEGGLLAQPTNSGTHSRDQFAFIPEAQ